MQRVVRMDCKRNGYNTQYCNRNFLSHITHLVVTHPTDSRVGENAPIVFVCGFIKISTLQAPFFAIIAYWVPIEYKMQA